MFDKNSNSESPSQQNIDKAINNWLSDNNLELNGEITISDDKTRAVVPGWAGKDTDAEYILDISKLDNIKQLAKKGWYNRISAPLTVKFKENDFIALARSGEFILYDYNSGDELSYKNIQIDSIWSRVTYLDITDNYAIYQQDTLSGNTLSKIDYTYRRYPIVTLLYSSANSYTLSDDKTKVLVKDKDNNLIEEIQIVAQEPTEPNMNEYINNWLSDNNLELNGEITISDNKKRAVIPTSSSNGNGTDTEYILDISNLDNIKQLAKRAWNNSNSTPQKVKFKENDFIALARSGEFVLYDYNSGEELSHTAIGKNAWWKGVDYIDITDNYVIYHYFIYPENIMGKIDYTDRRTPIETTLFRGQNGNNIYNFILSDDKTKVFVKDTDNNLIEEIQIVDKGVTEADIDKAINNWLSDNNLELNGKITISDDKTRVIISLPGDGHEPDYYIFLDTSDLDNIKKLNTMAVLGRDNAIHFQKMKEGDYVLFSTPNKLLIYDYNTGEHLSDSNGVSGEPPYPLTVDRLEDNYAIVSRPRLPDNKMTTYKIDFTDRRNPITTVISEKPTLSEI